MNKFISTMILCAFTLIGFAQNDKNYVKSFVAKAPVKTGLSQHENSAEIVQTTIEYFDGLGRPVQSIVKNHTPDGRDIITPKSYDQFGREIKSYLPYAGVTNGNYVSTAFEEQKAFYDDLYGNNTGNYAFSEQLFESSPLNRVMKQAAPGEVWKIDGQHTIDMTYYVNVDFNTGIDIPVKVLNVDESGLINYGNGNYLPGELKLNITTDENEYYKEGEVREFTDLQGRLILKQQKEASQRMVNSYISTQYVYDDLGNLRYVIPPAAMNEIVNAGNNWALLNDEAFQKKWMYCYRYDHRNRMVEKRIPGADWVYMVYDNRDRLILTQDGNQRKRFEWLFTKYDELNRPVLTGIYWIDLQGQNAMQQVVNNYFENAPSPTTTWSEKRGSSFHGYTNTAFPKVMNDSCFLTVTYYDDYDFTQVTFPGGALQKAIGQITGTKVRVLGQDKWLTTLSFYDNRYRPIKIESQNHLDGEDVIENEYINEISALVDRTTNTHTTIYSSDVLKVTEAYSYDHADRLLSTQQIIEQNGVLKSDKQIVTNEYNALGELKTKNLGKQSSGTFAQQVDFEYNIRGWLTRINGGGNALTGDDKFGMELQYDAAGEYNGNIGKIIWKSIGGTPFPGSPLIDETQSFTYQYDPLGRIKGATYESQSKNGFYDLSNVNYDHNGNIQSLTRKRDNSVIDQLTYEYAGNQLISVEDASTSTDGFINGATSSQEYFYDANGNMTSDLNKGISAITYNILNLPKVVYFDNGDKVSYWYDATGIKLSKSVISGQNSEHTDYVAGKHYVNGQLSFFNHAEGRVVLDGPGFDHEYHLTDHLGNVRVTINEEGQVVQRDDYYPFGLTFNSWHTSPKNEYLYNGKEFEEATGWYEYESRFHDAALGRFFTIDPKAEEYHVWSPYVYAANNPIRFVDVRGEGPGPVVVVTISKATGEDSEEFVPVKQITVILNYIEDAETGKFKLDENMPFITSDEDKSTKHKAPGTQVQISKKSESESNSGDYDPNGWGSDEIAEQELVVDVGFSTSKDLESSVAVKLGAGLKTPVFEAGGELAGTVKENKKVSYKNNSISIFSVQLTSGKGVTDIAKTYDSPGIKQGRVVHGNQTYKISIDMLTE